MYSLTNMEEERLKREVLQLINRARRAMRLPPLTVLPAGRRYGMGGTCTLAKALRSGCVGRDSIRIHVRHAEAVAAAWNVEESPDDVPASSRPRDTAFRWLYLPPLLVIFRMYYDEGAFPDLIEKPGLPPFRLRGAA